MIRHLESTWCVSYRTKSTFFLRSRSFRISRFSRRNPLPSGNLMDSGDSSNDDRTPNTPFTSSQQLVATPPRTQIIKPTRTKEAANLFAGAMPKKEIGALEFLKKYPESDGRGIVVAIFDTGVDPGAAGLSVTTDGKPKILDVLDCTGSGDVDTSKTVTADEQHCIVGASGRKLQLNPEWENPTGEWHVGCQRVYDVYAPGLVRRMKEERKKAWQVDQRAALQHASTELASFLSTHTGALSDEDSKMKDELEARLKMLTDLEDKVEDYGPVLDCVVWHDGKTWWAAIDTSDMEPAGSDKGCLADFTPMTDFKAQRQYATFSALDACNYCVNIYDDGKLLSIVADCGSHGTHVAGIVAAHHPEDPSLNGIAPGAQLISCKVGDNRLGSMETGVGLTRALIAVLQHKADMINMSYGEATCTPNKGRFIDLAEEVVHKHGVVFVSSAGNAGPALSTVGAPGGTASAILGIGAYVSPDLAAAGHSIREGLSEGQQYTWSSRGPAADGDIGVCLSAPGGAIAPVPQWTQESRQLMNGTSMASPNACGGIALILSGLKAAGATYSPNRVRRALENTCLPVCPEAADSVLTHGRGLLQVHKAFEYLSMSEEVDVPDVRYKVSVRRAGSAGPASRGVYLRDALEVEGAVTFSCNVKPLVHEDADTKAERLAVEDKLLVQCGALWVATPSALLLPFGGRTFEIEVDATRLPPGLHYTEVHAVDATAAWRGPLVRVPITVIVPENVRPLPSKHSGGNGTSTTQQANGSTSGGATVALGRLAFTPGVEIRRFVSVPEGARWASLSLTAGQHDNPIGFMVRATQLVPHTRYSSSEKRKYIQLAAYESNTSDFEVIPGCSLEITLSQFWSSLGEGSVEAVVDFHGIESRPATGVAIDGAAANAKLEVRGSLRSERLSPSGKLTHLRIPLRPTESQITPLPPPRDWLPEGRTIYRLLLTYSLDMKEAGEVVPRVPLLNGFVYDSVVEAQMYVLCDANKRKLSVGDIYPEPVTLKKGTYTIRLMVRHESLSTLTSMKTLPMVVERKLKSSISVPVYTTHADSLTGKNSMKDQKLAKGERVALFVGPVPDADLPADATPGRVLVGALTLGKGAEGGGNSSPDKISLTYVVPPKAADKGADKSSSSEEEEKSAADKLAMAIRDAKVSFLTNMKLSTDDDKALYNTLRAELMESYPKHLPLLLEDLKRAAVESDVKPDAKPASESESESSPEEGGSSSAIISAADAVLAVIDEKELGCYFAEKVHEEGPNAAKMKKDMDEAKSALVSALEKKCWAYWATLQKAQQEGDGGNLEDGKASVDTLASSAAASFESSFVQLRKWVDMNDAQYAMLNAHREDAAGRLAAAVKALDKAVSPEDKVPQKKALELRAQLFGKLGWTHWQAIEQSKIREYFPDSYPLL